MSEKKTIVSNLIKSFFVSFAWMNIGGIESTNILLVCVFGASYLLLTNKDVFVSEKKNNERVSSYILGALFVTLYALYADLTGGLSNKLYIAVYLISTAIGLFVMFSGLAYVLINKSVRFISCSVKTEHKAFSSKVFVVYTIIVFAFCTLFLALNYPGVMTTDSLNQFSQIVGVAQFNNHHPWIHTAIIGIFYKIGYAISRDVYVGIACYTVFQMLVVSASVGYAIECLYEYGIDRKWRILMILCFVGLPYNLAFAVTIWKDILFTMSVLVLTITMIRISVKDTLRDNVLYCISALGMCLLRHNGFYAYVVTVVVWLFIKRKELKCYIIYSSVIVVIALLCRGPVMKMCNVKPGEYVYNMCIPLQQIGQIVVDGSEITKEEEEWLLQINTLDYIRAGYSSQCADPMFAWVLDGDEEFFDSHQNEFIKLWIEIGVRHPIKYIKTVVDLTLGYWAPMKPQQTVYFGITPNNAFGLSEKPIIKGPVLIKINELLTKLYEMIPLYGFMYCMGGFFWIMLILLNICIITKQYDKIFAFLPVFTLTLTLIIATPLVADLRYGYAIVLILPYLGIHTYINNKNNIEEETKC